MGCPQSQQGDRDQQPLVGHGAQPRPALGQAWQAAGIAQGRQQRGQARQVVDAHVPGSAHAGRAASSFAQDGWHVEFGMSLFCEVGEVGEVGDVCMAGRGTWASCLARRLHGRARNLRSQAHWAAALQRSPRGAGALAAGWAAALTSTACSRSRAAAMASPGTSAMAGWHISTLPEGYGPASAAIVPSRPSGPSKP